MTDFNKLASARKVTVTYYVPDNIDKDYVKTFRINHELTQNALATILGVSKKAVEKWEQGKNNINGSSEILLSLINDDAGLLKKLYSVKVVESQPQEAEFTTITTMSAHFASTEANFDEVKDCFKKPIPALAY